MLLRIVASGQTDGSVTALASAAGLAVPTSHHLLSTLCAEGMLARDSHGRYILGPAVSILASSMDRELAPAAPLVSSVTALTKATQETSYLALWRGGGVHIAATFPGKHPIQVGVPNLPYRDTPARATGRIFLAHMPPLAREAYLAEHPLRRVTPRTITAPDEYLSVLSEIRTHGYAIDQEEFQEGVCCVSAGVVIEGTAIAAFSVSAPKQRWDQNSASIIEATRAAASAAAAAMTAEGLLTRT
jgi:IclR family transcriptional regulator, acetate operon repressor